MTSMARTGKRQRIQEYQEGQKLDTWGLLWDIALARGQSNTNAAQCLSHCSLLATSHVVIENTGKCGQ